VSTWSTFGYYNSIVAVPYYVLPTPTTPQLPLWDYTRQKLYCFLGHLLIRNGTSLGLWEFQVSVLQIKWTPTCNHSILHWGISVCVVSQRNISIFIHGSQSAILNQAVQVITMLCLYTVFLWIWFSFLELRVLLLKMPKENTCITLKCWAVTVIIKSVHFRWNYSHPK
jgi:hypothetical protein